MHGGGVDVDSAVGEGTTFRVRVPLGTAHLPDDRVSSGPSSRGAARSAEVAAQAQGFVAEALRWLEPAPGPRQRGGEPDADDRAQVLVVDDNADMREYVAELLGDRLRRPHGGRRARGSRQGARRSARTSCVTDVMMPRLDGFGLLRELQSDDATASIPVIMLSARAGEEGTVEGLEAGADDYLVKPFSARELRARVRVNLELDRNRQVRSALERNRDLLDQAQRLAKVGSWEVDLSTGALDRVGGGPPRARSRRTRARGARLPAASWSSVVHPEDRDRVAAAVDRGDGRARRPGRGEPDPAPERRAAHGRGACRGEHRARRTASGCAARSRTSPSSAGRSRPWPRPRPWRRPPRASTRSPTSCSAACCRDLAFDLEHLDVATYYRAGVEGTQVGGDWYDVIELGRRADRPRRRRRDGPRRERRRDDGPAAGRGPGLREAGPAAGRGPGVPRRHRAGPRRRPDRHVPLRGLRPDRPDPPLLQRRAPAADARASRAGRSPGSTVPDRHSGPATSGCAPSGCS